MSKLIQLALQILEDKWLYMYEKYPSCIWYFIFNIIFLNFIQNMHMFFKYKINY